MNDADAKVRQQIVEKIKNSTNILVTVSRDPSVDDLSAALALTVLLNKLDKHATAIFSGAIPPAITFLEPDKVFENTADSLRDFIIALDKEKADHLRYKVEGDVVKIFITPYHTTITANDLEFSQGDFNVELVLALGIANQDSLDMSLAAHGRILHDVTVATLCAGDQSSRLGNIYWSDTSASSLSEMVTMLSDALKTDDKPILDKQIATALLTGIVASTDRFSNPRTSSRVMTIAAQLMAIGADQQLIAAKLQESHEINSLPISHGGLNTEPPVDTAPSPTEEPPIVEQSTLPPEDLKIDHESSDTIKQIIEKANDLSTISTIPQAASTLDAKVAPTSTSTIAPASESASTLEPSETTLPQPLIIDSHSPMSTIAPAYAPPEPEPELKPEPETQELPPPQPEPTLPPMPTDNLPQIQNVAGMVPADAIEPSLGGELNATTDQAADEMRRELESQQNKTILKHAYLGDAENDHNAPINSVEQPDDMKDVDIFADAPMAETPQVFDMPMPPPLPDFSTLPPPPIVEPVIASELGGMSQQPVGDPSQFKIPGSN